MENDTIENMTDEDLARHYREWFNDFLTVERFAEYQGFSLDTANAVIYYGREAHNRQARDSK